jgi:hypothetical protein
VFTELTRGRGLPLVVVSALAGLAVLVALRLDSVRPVRPLAALAVAAVIWGWAIAQYPDVLPPRLTIAAAAAPAATEVTELIVVGIIVVLVVPSFVMLFRLAQSGRLGQVEATPAGPLAHGDRRSRAQALSSQGRPSRLAIAVVVAIIVAEGLRRRRAVPLTGRRLRAVRPGPRRRRPPSRAV